jgi:glutamyl/glutaminyl-tRNA synthetase
MADQAQPNIVAEVANGNSPQPVKEVPTDLEALQSEAEDAIDMHADSPEDATEESSIDAAQKAGDITPKEAQVLKKKLKLKVDGEEFEEEVDWNNEDEIKKHYQKSRAFDKRVKEFTGYKSQVEQLLHMLENDPEALLEKMGKNVDEMAEKRLSRKIEEMKKSPEQLEREKMEKELKDLREEKKKALEDQQRAEEENLRNKTANEIENEIMSALDDAKSILPKKNPLVLQRISAAMLLAIKNGYPQVSVKDVIPLVEKQWKQELNEFFGVTSEEALEQLVGKANLDKYRKSKVSQKKVLLVNLKKKLQKRALNQYLTSEINPQ